MPANLTLNPFRVVAKKDAVFTHCIKKRIAADLVYCRIEFIIPPNDNGEEPVKPLEPLNKIIPVMYLAKIIY
ncbi:MAG: hypothetical protein QXH20_05995 [Candidatus Bathyarchaeia archaeon]